MRIGDICVDGRPVGFIDVTVGTEPNLDGYTMGRADQRPLGALAGPVHRGHGEPHFGPSSHHQHDHRAAPAHRDRFGGEGDLDPPVERAQRRDAQVSDLPASVACSANSPPAVNARAPSSMPSRG